jgi:hypothetical protein
MNELRTWLQDHGFAVISEDSVDLGVLLVLQPPAGKTIRLVFRPDLPPDELIDLVRDIYAQRLERLN